MRNITSALILSIFCIIPLGVTRASSVSYISIDSTSSSVNRWGGSGFNNVYGVEGIIAVTIDSDSFISFNFDAVKTKPDSGSLGSPFAPDVFYDGLSFDNRGQYACTGACVPVVYDELWGTFDGTGLSFEGSGSAFDYKFSINGMTISAVPAPAAGALFVSGILGLIGCAGKRS